MNPTNEPDNEPTNATTPPPLPTPPPPVPPDAPPGEILQALLKRPAQLLAAVQERGVRLPWLLALFAFGALAAYGAVVGSFSGGTQWLAAPLKVSLGAFASAAICLPSLFIFASFSGAEVTLRGVVGALCAVLALTALMLIGLMPVMWVFSQSTESFAFMGALHLALWLVALGIGLRLIRMLLEILHVRRTLHLRLWMMIFVCVSLQMTTALRPLLGTSEHWLPTEKKFFIAYWFENIAQSGSGNSSEPARARASTTPDL